MLPAKLRYYPSYRHNFKNVRQERWLFCEACSNSNLHRQEFLVCITLGQELQRLHGLCLRISVSDGNVPKVPEKVPVMKTFPKREQRACGKGCKERERETEIRVGYRK